MLCIVNLPSMIHLVEFWFSSSKVMLCSFTTHLYNRLQKGNHYLELSPSTKKSIVTGWDHSDFMSTSMDIKSPCMLHLLNNLPIFNYFQSYLSCHYTQRKSRYTAMSVTKSISPAWIPPPTSIHCVPSYFIKSVIAPRPFIFPPR